MRTFSARVAKPKTSSLQHGGQGKGNTSQKLQLETTSGVEIDSTETQCLRQEITTRITLMHAVIALELAVLGTGLTTITKPTYILTALGAASSFLWLQWMEQSLYTYKIAAYLSVHLAPQLSRLVCRPVLGWETFLRHVEANGEESCRALYPGTAGGGRRLMLSGRYAEWYIPLLFAVTPPLLIALYASDTRDGLARVLPACLTAGLTWAYTIIRFVLLIHDIHVLNDAIAATEAT
jgi:hypothetical protein